MRCKAPRTGPHTLQCSVNVCCFYCCGSSLPWGLGDGWESQCGRKTAGSPVSPSPGIIYTQVCCTSALGLIGALPMSLSSESVALCQSWGHRLYIWTQEHSRAQYLCHKHQPRPRRLPKVAPSSVFLEPWSQDKGEAYRPLLQCGGTFISFLSLWLLSIQLSKLHRLWSQTCLGLDSALLLLSVWRPEPVLTQCSMLKWR